MYKPIRTLSENTKCEYSINLPVSNCTPTKNCWPTCYARTGRCSMPRAKKKQQWMSDYLKNGKIDELIKESRKVKAVRINGTGDLLPKHIPTILNLAKNCPHTQFWGMTRKVNIAQELNNKLPNLTLLVSVDASSPKSVWNYQGAMCWGPRYPQDKIPNDPRIKTVFPTHVYGKVIKNCPHHPKDCKAVWHEIDGCMNCQRCWNFSES